MESLLEDIVLAKLISLYVIMLLILPIHHFCSLTIKKKYIDRRIKKELFIVDKIVDHHLELEWISTHLKTFQK